MEASGRRSEEHLLGPSLRAWGASLGRSTQCFRRLLGLESHRQPCFPPATCPAAQQADGSLVHPREPVGAASGSHGNPVGGGDPLMGGPLALRKPEIQSYRVFPPSGKMQMLGSPPDPRPTPHACPACPSRVPALHPPRWFRTHVLRRPKTAGSSSRVRYWTPAVPSQPAPGQAANSMSPCLPVSRVPPAVPVAYPPVPPPRVPAPLPSYSLPAAPSAPASPGRSPPCVPSAGPMSPPRVSPPPRAPAELWDRRAQEVAGRRGRGRRAAGRAGRDGGRGRRAPHSLRPDAGPGAPRAGARRPSGPERRRRRGHARRGAGGGGCSTPEGIRGACGLPQGGICRLCTQSGPGASSISPCAAPRPLLRVRSCVCGQGLPESLVPRLWKALQVDPMLSRATFGTCLSARVRLISLCRHRQVTATVWTALVEVPGGKRFLYQLKKDLKMLASYSACLFWGVCTTVLAVALAYYFYWTPLVWFGIGFPGLEGLFPVDLISAASVSEEEKGPGLGPGCLPPVPPAPPFLIWHFGLAVGQETTQSCVSELC
uniref:Uncharacterized protein n=1 Tax=Rangifer tarandus platyrhynchus TaxID=3082113 RepID=A0ACB0FAB9_RANTA|nr:unnamed protein product [Rangifer tarandus platyrhynchus]